MLLGSAALGVYFSTTPGCACGGIFPTRVHNLYTLNLLRDREPERVADKFLRDQSSRKCEPMRSDLCKHALQMDTVSDWRLQAREDSRSGVVLYYFVELKSDIPSDRWFEAAVWVDSDGGRWQVTDFKVP
jgi:hypothetical protein